MLSVNPEGKIHTHLNQLLAINALAGVAFNTHVSLAMYDIENSKHYSIIRCLFYASSLTKCNNFLFTRIVLIFHPEQFIYTYIY